MVIGVPCLQSLYKCMCRNVKMLEILKLAYEFVENFIIEIVHPKAMPFIYGNDIMTHNSPFRSCLLVIAH